MPELPEVETVRRGLAPACVGRRFGACAIRETRLRWPVSARLGEQLAGQTIHRLDRRGKYLLFRLDHGSLIVHLGMTGRLLRIVQGAAAAKHDHADLHLDDGFALRFSDPRRFGAILFSENPDDHPLIASLGAEPLAAAFDGDALYRLTRGRRVTIKSFIMDAHQIAGVGNIYANESLFRAGIRPLLPAGKLGRPRAERLATAIKTVLCEAIAAGGSTLRDYVDGFGNAGWFQLNYFVYGREGQSCRVCGGTIKSSRAGGRATTWCPHCQR